MTTLKFHLAPHTLQFECGSEYPGSHYDEVVQVTDRTAGGTLQVETLGVTIEQKTLAFTHMPKADYDALVNWYKTISQGALHTFEYTDEFGTIRNVKILSGSMDFAEVFLNTYSGSLQLEVV